jgi:hypothetical protein
MQVQQRKVVERKEALAKTYPVHDTSQHQHQHGDTDGPLTVAAWDEVEELEATIRDTRRRIGKVVQHIAEVLRDIQYALLDDEAFADDHHHHDDEC